MKRVDKHRDRCLLLKPIISQPASLSVSLNIFVTHFFPKTDKKKLLKISLVCDTTTRTLYALVWLASAFEIRTPFTYQYGSDSSRVLLRHSERYCRENQPPRLGFARTRFALGSEETNRDLDRRAV